MKLNPPETAPRDGTTILIHLDKLKICPAAWSVSDHVWMVAHAAKEWQFRVFPVSHKYVTGWLPLPQIDDEGNVI